MLQIGSLTEAIEAAKPAMAETVNDTSAGAILLAVWAAKNLTWADLQTLPTTKFKLAMKDPDEARGKRFCTKGQIVEIQVEKSPYGKVFNGIMMTNGYKVVRFIAAGSTGELVADDRARYCGIVTEINTYSNAGGGTSHALYTVGMFDLPENKAPKLTAR